MTETEHDELEWPDPLPVPAWMNPILRGEAEKRAELTRQNEDTWRHAAGAINRRLASLGIEPLSPAEWSRETGLIKAVLLKPDHCDVDEWGVSVGWTDEITVYSVSDGGTEYPFGPLGSVQDASDARRGPRAVKPEPPDHERLAEEELARAAQLNADGYDTGELAILSAVVGLARAVLALNDTVSRLGVRQALRQAAALGEIPLDQVALTAEEKRRLRELFPHAATAAADTGQIAELSALDGI